MICFGLATSKSQSLSEVDKPDSDCWAPSRLANEISETLLNKPEDTIDLTSGTTDQAEMNVATDSSDIWKEYDSSVFAPDVVVTDASSSSASGSVQVPGISSENDTGNHGASNLGGQLEWQPTLLDIDDKITASQRSFSYLNINQSNEDPYSAAVDIDF